MRLCGEYLGAHRIAYECTRGIIPDGLQIDHLCCQKNCVNPFHMEPVTIAENQLRIFKRSSTCKNRKHFKEIGATKCLICMKEKLHRGRPRMLAYLKKYNALPKAVAAKEKWRHEHKDYLKAVNHQRYLKLKGATNAPTESK